MRGPGRGPKARATGFIAAEMIILLLMLVAFMAGVVLTVDRGVSTFDSGKGDAGLAEESEHVFDGLASILGSAEAISLEHPGLEPVFNRVRLVLMADLDGSGEPEAVLVRQRPTEPGELQVLVADVGGGPGSSELSNMLDRSRTAPLTLEYRSPDGRKAASGSPVGEVSSVRASVWLRSGNRSERFSRLIELDRPLPVEPIGIGQGVL